MYSTGGWKLALPIQVSGSGHLNLSLTYEQTTKIHSRHAPLSFSQKENATFTGKPLSPNNLATEYYTAIIKENKLARKGS